MAVGGMDQRSGCGRPITDDTGRRTPGRRPDATTVPGKRDYL